MSSSSKEPEFIAQNGEHLTAEQRRQWFRSRTEEAKAEGAVLCRYSVHETMPNLILFEAWTARPSDQGEPRWQISA